MGRLEMGNHGRGRHLRMQTAPNISNSINLIIASYFSFAPASSGKKRPYKFGASSTTFFALL